MKEIISNSNLSSNEQNNFILKNILSPSNFNYSFLNRNLSGLKGSNFGILFDSEIVSEKKEVHFVISARLLKEILVLLRKNPIRRNFIIFIRNNKVVVNDILFNDMREYSSIPFYNCKNGSFILNSSIFFFFKLNEKTINDKSMVYITEDMLIYENIRNKNKVYYIKEI